MPSSVSPGDAKQSPIVARERESRPPEASVHVAMSGANLGSVYFEDFFAAFAVVFLADFFVGLLAVFFAASAGFSFFPSGPRPVLASVCT